MKIRFLGSGTSQGVPVLTCSCEVCLSDDIKDKRLRSSVLISDDKLNVVIDCGPDFRQQMLEAKVNSLDAILLTHEHNDHIIGLDDVRPYNFRAKKSMKIYGLKRVLDDVRSRFSYVFKQNPYPGSPRIELIELKPFEDFSIGSMRFTSIPVQHGDLDILGYRVGSLAYLTDASMFDDTSINQLKNLDYIIINALHQKKHHSHMNLSEAQDFINETKPKKAYLTHISHLMGKHEKIEKDLSAGTKFAFDGLTFDFN